VAYVKRAAQPISSADSGERSVAARWLWAAPGLRSGRFASAAAAIYTVYTPNIGNTPLISRRSVLVAPLCFICIGYNWVPSPPSGEAEKWSNSEIGPNSYVIISGYGMGMDRLVWAAAPPAVSFIFESCQLHFLFF
jgi:hypothetical protein